LWINFKQYLGVHLEKLEETTKTPVYTIGDLSEIRVRILHVSNALDMKGASFRSVAVVVDIFCFHRVPFIRLNLQSTLPTEKLGPST
jgi:hypothetical protein